MAVGTGTSGYLVMPTADLTMVPTRRSTDERAADALTERVAS